MTQTLLQQRIFEFVKNNGDSFRKAAVVLQMDHAYLYRLAHGEKDVPPNNLLLTLKLKRTVTYEAADGVRVEAERLCPWQNGKCPVPAKCNDAGVCLNVPDRTRGVNACDGGQAK